MTQQFVPRDSSPSLPPKSGQPGQGTASRRAPALGSLASTAPARAHVSAVMVDGTAFGGSDATPTVGVVPEALSVVQRTVRNLAVQDWVFLAYFTIFFFALVFGSGPNRPPQMMRVGGDMLVLVTGLLATRGELLQPGTRLSSLVYRFTIFGTIFLSYFQLQYILPGVSSRAFDAQILSLDMKLFGFEPAVAWDQFVTPVTTEWFAFFYFGYFGLLALHVLPFLLWAKDRDLTARFSLGVYTVFCTAHILYMVVPGFGPYKTLHFDHELTGGPFWHLVVQTVTGAGAQKDIFPSLHTAVPTYFVLFSFINRHRAPFKYTWPLVAAFASQIVIATMFLRWHYLIDIFAGMTLATCAVIASTKINAWERARRTRLGLPPIFGPALSFRRSPR